jgi:hypothetical protein
VLSELVESSECRDEIVGSRVPSRPESFTVRRIVGASENLFLTVIDNRNSVCEADQDGEVSEACNIRREASDTRIVVILDEIPKQYNVLGKE